MPFATMATAVSNVSPEKLWEGLADKSFLKGGHPGDFFLASNFI
jgi:hypothetical protein